MLLDENDKKYITDLIDSLNPNQFKGLTSKIKSLYPDIFEKLKKICEDLSLKNVSEAIYLVINNMDKPPECESISDKCTHKLTFKTIIEGYTKYCKKCTSLSEDFIQKRMETNMDKYGTKFPNQNEEVKKKISESHIGKTRKPWVANKPLINKFGFTKNPKRNISLNFTVGGQ